MKVSKLERNILHDKYLRKTGFSMEDKKWWVNNGTPSKEVYKIWLDGFTSLDQYSDYMNNLMY